MGGRGGRAGSPGRDRRGRWSGGSGDRFEGGSGGERERERSGFTPPGVHRNPEEANGKQWGRETRGQGGAARDRETGGPDRWEEGTEGFSPGGQRGGERPGAGASGSGVPTGCRGAPVGETRVPGTPEGSVLSRVFRRGTEAVKAGVCREPRAHSEDEHSTRRARPVGGEGRGEAATGG